MSAPRLVVAGNLLVDDLVFADGNTRLCEAGGAVLYAATSASLWSDGIACLSRSGDDYPAAALHALHARGVDMSGVSPLGRSGGRTWLLYECSDWRMVPRLGRPTHEAVSPAPDDVPASWRQAAAVHLCPMPLSCQQALLDGWSANTFISIDPHLPLRDDTLSAWLPILHRVDAIFLGESELLLDGVREQPLSALRPLRGGRLRYVICKRGAAGGLLYDTVADRLIPWPARAAQIVDPTGCGDAFAAGFVTALLDGAALDAALSQGVVSASFALAGWGASAILSTTPEAARARRGTWYDVPGTHSA